MAVKIENACEKNEKKYEKDVKPGQIFQLKSNKCWYYVISETHQICLFDGEGKRSVVVGHVPPDKNGEVLAIVDLKDIVVKQVWP